MSSAKWSRGDSRGGGGARQRIEDYALIGDQHTAALVGKDGSIDWLCVPSFDSAACFAALLGGPEHGRWQIAPARGWKRVRRRYRPATLILETEFETEEGACLLIDFMPTEGHAPNLVRILRGLRGRVPLRMELAVRFDYGRQVPWVSRTEEGALLAVAGPHLLVLRTPLRHQGRAFATQADFTLAAGEEIPFVLTYGASHLEVPGPTAPGAALAETEAFWRDWAERCNYQGPWRDAVVRSLITLKALTYLPTGGIVAAPTTSLPEQPGGERNWDYRFCWLRDATFTLLSLMDAGYREEARAWRAWLERAVAGHPSQVQPIYSIRGEWHLREWEVPWLPGYGGAAPARVGNEAYAQLQLDAFGEVLDALQTACRYGLSPPAAAWPLQRAMTAYLEELVDRPDSSIWEMRGPPQHFTHSKVMIWVAFDRAVTAVERHGLDGPVERWRALRDRLHAEICTHGFDPELGAFVQAYVSKQLDAATLMIPLVGFLPAKDPRMVGTVEAIRRHLMKDGLVMRYNTSSRVDGLHPGEGVFLACSFWLADNLILQGRRDEGRALFERLVGLCNDVGLLGEEYDPASGSMLGNFPQALSHVALIDTAYNLQRVHGPARERSHKEAGRGRQRHPAA